MASISAISAVTTGGRLKIGCRVPRMFGFENGAFMGRESKGKRAKGKRASGDTYVMRGVRRVTPRLAAGGTITAALPRFLPDCVTPEWHAGCNHGQRAGIGARLCPDPAQRSRRRAVNARE